MGVWGFGVWGLQFRVQGLAFEVRNFRFCGVGLRVERGRIRGGRTIWAHQVCEVGFFPAPK